MQTDSSSMARLKTAARAFEDHVAEWPLWRKSLVLIPVFLVLASLLVMALYAIGASVPRLFHH